MKSIYNVLLLVILCFFQKQLNGQTIGLSVSKKAPPQSRFYRDVPYLSVKKHFQTLGNPVVNPKNKTIPAKIPLVFSVETLPFFCKIEHKMGLNQKLPLKFRLGDVQYVEALEHKPQK